MSSHPVHLVPVLQDNYAFVVQSGDKACLFDVGEAKPITHFLDEKGLQLDLIVITHHHWDHTDGLEELVEKYSPKVIGPEGLKTKLSYSVTKDGKSFAWEGLNFEVIATPGHTLDHLIYFQSDNKWLFSGDLICGSGCGRVFEGTYEMALDSLRKLSRFPKETQVFCSHEYTLANCRFADDLCNYAPFKVKKEHVESIRAKNQATIPLSLEDERKTNPFLLVDSKEFRSLMKIEDARELFKFIRDQRNKL